MEAVSQKILIVAHDAGGSEVVSAWVKTNPQNSYYFILDGPAISIFFRKLSKFQNSHIDQLNCLLGSVDFVLTATSWGSDLERKVIKEAKSQNICVASYLDHWCNYNERFILQGESYLPDEVWVGDQAAYDLAKNIFQDIEVRFVANQYFIEIQEEYKKILIPKTSDKLNILYICEPIEGSSFWKTGDKNYRGYTEFSALQLFFDRVNDIGLSSKVGAIKLRLHPSEDKQKYNGILETEKKRFVYRIDLSEKTTLLEDLAWADWVVGVSSMALIIAALVNKQVFSCIPSNANVTKLPIKKIIDFDTLNELARQ